MISSESYRSMAVLSRSMAVVALASGLAVGAGAQATAEKAAGDGFAVAGSTDRPLDLATVAGVNYSSSSSSADVVEPMEFPGAGLQPPPRRTYGRPRYNDKSHNPDGSSKWTGDGAVGFTNTLGDTYQYFNTSWAIQIGFGRRFSKKFAVPVQFDYDHFGVTGQALGNESTIYNNDPQILLGSSIDGNNHIWSFTLDPTYTFLDTDKYGAYVVGGVGYYHKVTNFTVAETVTGIYYGYPVSYSENAVIDHYTSNAPGFNAGFGLTYKFSRFADERFFAEVRYVFIDNSQRTGLTIGNWNSTAYGPNGENYTGSNFFPANSNKTTYIPVKFGIRF